MWQERKKLEKGSLYEDEDIDPEEYDNAVEEEEVESARSELLCPSYRASSFYCTINAIFFFSVICRRIIRRSSTDAQDPDAVVDQITESDQQGWQGERPMAEVLEEVNEGTYDTQSQTAEAYKEGLVQTTEQSTTEVV